MSSPKCHSKQSVAYAQVYACFQKISVYSFSNSFCLYLSVSPSLPVFHLAFHLSCKPESRDCFILHGFNHLCIPEPSRLLKYWLILFFHKNHMIHPSLIKTYNFYEKHYHSFFIPRTNLCIMDVFISHIFVKQWENYRNEYSPDVMQ